MEITKSRQSDNQKARLSGGHRFFMEKSLKIKAASSFYDVCGGQYQRSDQMIHAN